MVERRAREKQKITYKVKEFTEHTRSFVLLIVAIISLSGTIVGSIYALGAKRQEAKQRIETIEKTQKVTKQELEDSKKLIAANAKAISKLVSDSLLAKQRLDSLEKVQGKIDLRLEQIYQHLLNSQP